jgi:hypothetical protein
LATFADANRMLERVPIELAKKVIDLVANMASLESNSNLTDVKRL